MLFNVTGLAFLINDLNKDIYSMLIKCARDTKLGTHRIAESGISNDLDRLELGAESRKMNCNRDNCEVTDLG